jgi:predicted MPP superfamily phosphohydrolase
MVILILAWAGAVLGPLLMWPLWRRGRRLAAVLLAIPYALGVWSVLIEPRLLVVRHVTIESAAWRGPPVRLGILSDTHAGSPHVTPQRVARVAARLSAERPDIVLLLGDYAGRSEPAAMRAAADRSAVLRGVAALAGAQAPLGRVGVLGNHDWWYGAGDIRAALRRAGVAPLENQTVRVARPGGAFWIAGLTDLDAFRGWPDAATALAAVPPDEPAIVLTHAPDPWPQIPPRVALTLAGHSHCGQVWLPLLGRPVEPSPGARRWPCHRYDEGGRTLYVTGGLGTSILPVRFATPPEIVIVTLTGRP